MTSNALTTLIESVLALLNHVLALLNRILNPIGKIFIFASSIETLRGRDPILSAIENIATPVLWDIESLELDV